MADDIVNLLANMATNHGKYSTHYDGCHVYHLECAALMVCAEIERLRAAGDALHDAIRSHNLTEAHLKTWEEARRER